jgi:hypothetical protein
MLAAGAIGSIKSGVMGGWNANEHHHQVDPNAYSSVAGQGWNQAAGQQAEWASQRSAPQLGTADQARVAQLGPAAQYAGANINRAEDLQARNAQMGLMGQLQQQAMGKGPSLASGQLQQGIEASLKAQQAAAASQRGRISAGLQARQLSNGAAEMQQAASMQSAQLRMQEQLNAQAGLANLSGQVRGQDLGVAAQQAQLMQQAGLANTGAQNQFSLAQAGFQQQANMANQEWQNKFSMADQEARMRQMGMNDEQIARMLGMQQQTSFFDAEAQQKRQQLEADIGMHNAELDFKASEAKRERKAKFWGGLMGAGGSMMAGLSDERQKTDIKSGDKKLKEFYDALGSHSYKYKNPSLPGAGGGEYVSPMAQELEKSFLGRSMVKETDNGKMVDYAKGFGAMLAGQAYMHRELTDLKKALKGRK